MTAAAEPQCSASRAGCVFELSSSRTTRTSRAVVPVDSETVLMCATILAVRV